MIETYPLSELQTYIKRVIAANMPDAVWIAAEIAACGISRGHYYIDLVEKSENGSDIKARASAALWAKDATRLHKKLGLEVVQNLLQAGRQVRLAVRVEYHEQYGMKLVIADIDPVFTVGVLELERRAILERLQNEYLIDANKEIPMPAVPQRIALISSSSAAGYQDFIQHIFNNIYGYNFEITLFDCAMQGVSVTADVCAAFDEIDAQYSRFDAVVAVRGGGSRLDLACFDAYEIAARAAVLQLPLIVGIGHDIDESVLDMVANTSLKTPTAVADFLVERLAEFEAGLHECTLRLQAIKQQKITAYYNDLDQSLRLLQRGATQIQHKNAQNLAKIAATLPYLVQNSLKTHHTNLAQAEQKIALLDPKLVLKRGFSMTTFHSKPITNSSTLNVGDVVETRTADGSFRSTVV